MLDDLKGLKKIDKSGMIEAIKNMPENFEEAKRLTEEFMKGIRIRNILNVVITGLGGSAIGGDLVRMFIARKATIPVIVNRDYFLPAFADQNTLVIVSSYSGNTEETLSAYDDARLKGSRLIAITTGGKLKEKALEDGIPVLTIPPGLSPRAALGYSFIPLLIIIERLGIIPGGVSREIEDAIKIMKEARGRFSPEVPEAENPAKGLARQFHKKLPIIYGSSGTTEIIAMRWKGQINENSKAPAYFNTFPELNHNEIVGWDGPEEILKGFQVVILRDEGDYERVQKRIEITREIINNKGGEVLEVWSEGGTCLARMFYLIMLGDFASVYLAALYKKDPTPVNLIDLLKKRLSN